jgi:hypothetical protein
MARAMIDPKYIVHKGRQSWAGGHTPLTFWTFVINYDLFNK